MVSESTGTPPGAPRLLLIVGAQRSGTTYLQRLVGSHPEVATTQETELLSSYLGRCDEVWGRHLGAPGRTTRRNKGLPALLTQEEFDDLLRGFATAAYAKLASLKPSATAVLDKSPDYSWRLPFAFRLFPHARAVHIIRDGRDVVASMRRASTGWGKAWAPSSMQAAAEAWVARASAAHAARDAGPVLEIRYEDLLADGPGVLTEVYAHLGLPHDREVVTAALAANDRAAAAAGTYTDSLLWSGEVAARAGAQPTEPEGFVGEGRPGTWERLTVDQRLVVERTAGPLLREFGYTTDSSWVGAGALRRQAWTLRQDALDRGRAGLGRRLDALRGS